MMRIILVRHAKSAHDYSRWKTDDIRPLADVGIKRQENATRGMVHFGLNYDSAWVSPFVRAQQTLEIIQAGFGSDISPEIVDELKVWGDPEKVKVMLDKYFRNNSSKKLLVVGHNPNISDLVQLLTGKAVDLRTSEVVTISIDEGYHFERHYTRSELSCL